MTTIDADTAKLAGLQIDLLQKMRQGQMTMEHLEWFNNLSRQQRDLFLSADLKVVEWNVLPINRTKPFNPSEFIGPGWAIWRGPKDGSGLEGEEEQDVRSLALMEINLSKLLLEAHLKNGEGWTTGEERIERLDAANRIKLDAKIFQTLWENRHKLPERFKQKINSYTTYIFCDGTVLRSPEGRPCSPCFCWDSDDLEWERYYDWLGLQRFAYYPSVVLASQS